MRLSRWVIILTYAVFAYASGFVPLQVDKQLFLRNMPSVQASNGQQYETSQIRELGIETEKADIAVKNNSSGVEEWGISKQLSEHTWTIRVGQDATNGTAQEIFVALNNYRQRYGKGTLNWDENLANYAQSRAVYFVSKGDLDSHAGFSDYINNQDGFHKLGFMSLGENSSYGYTLEAVHLIEWVYAGDKPHDDNQLNSEWTHVGIGVSGGASNLIFGGKKI